MLIKSRRMPSNQDFGLSNKDAYQCGRRFAASNPSTKTLVMLKPLQGVPEPLIELKNGSTIVVVDTIDNIDINEFSFFVYGEGAVDDYFDKINSKEA